MSFLKRLFEPKPSTSKKEEKKKKEDKSFNPQKPGSWAGFVLKQKVWANREAAIRAILENTPNSNYGDVVWSIINDMNFAFPNTTLNHQEKQHGANLRCKEHISREKRIEHFRYYKIGA